MRHSIAKLDEASVHRDMRLAAEAIRGPALQLLGYAERPQGAPPIRLIAQQLLSLADDLQDNASLGPIERLSVELEHVALAPLVRQVAASVMAVMGGVRHWRVGAAIESLAIKADRRALQQILTRVFSNAARFSLDGDWIDIDAHILDDRLVVQVQDEGHPPAVGTGLSTDRRGLGFGLVLSRQLMQAHGGVLALESAPGIGTCVSLTFPRDLLMEG